MWQAQPAPAAHKCASDPGMKREWKVKLARHKGAALNNTLYQRTNHFASSS